MRKKDEYSLIDEVLFTDTNINVYSTEDSTVIEKKNDKLALTLKIIVKKSVDDDFSVRYMFYDKLFTYKNFLLSFNSVFNTVNLLTEKLEEFTKMYDEHEFKMFAEKIKSLITEIEKNKSVEALIELSDALIELYYNILFST